MSYAFHVQMKKWHWNSRWSMIPKYALKSTNPKHRPPSREKTLGYIHTVFHTNRACTEFAYWWRARVASHGVCSLLLWRQEAKDRRERRKSTPSCGEVASVGVISTIDEVDSLNSHAKWDEPAIRSAESVLRLQYPQPMIFTYGFLDATLLPSSNSVVDRWNVPWLTTLNLQVILVYPRRKALVS
jgi:hypothetical protein